MNAFKDGGGSCRRPFSWIDDSRNIFNNSMNPYVLSRYLARAPFGQGWIISIDNMEDLSQYSCSVAHYNQAFFNNNTSFYMVR